MDLITKIRKALELEDSADETAVLKALDETIGNAKLGDALREIDGLEIADDADTATIAKAIGDAVTDEDEDKTSLEDRAKAEGKRVVTDSTFDELTRNAAKGAEAAEELRVSKFETAFDDALDGLRVDAKDETKDRFRKFYDVAPEQCLEQLEKAPRIANAEGRGSGKGKQDVPDGVDGDRHDLDTRVKAHMKEHKVSDYAEALDAVIAEEGAAA